MRCSLLVGACRVVPCDCLRFGLIGDWEADADWRGSGAPSTTLRALDDPTPIMVLDEPRFMGAIRGGDRHYSASWHPRRRTCRAEPPYWQPLSSAGDGWPRPPRVWIKRGQPKSPEPRRSALARKREFRETNHPLGYDTSWHGDCPNPPGQRVLCRGSATTQARNSMTAANLLRQIVNPLRFISIQCASPSRRSRHLGVRPTCSR
jgi:hypothetical protein